MLLLHEIIVCSSLQTVSLHLAALRTVSTDGRTQLCLVLLHLKYHSVKH